MKVFPQIGLGVLPNFAFIGKQQFPSSNDWHASPLVSFTHEFIYPFRAQSILPATFSITNWKRNRLNSSLEDEHSTPPKNTRRIGIVGGGVCGISVAYALAKNLRASNDNNAKITVFEGDPHSAATASITTIEDQKVFTPPKWTAAAARNANSIVPGAAMHVFSRKSVLWDVMRDTVMEWYSLKQEIVQDYLPFGDSTVSRQDDFGTSPPYFALHLWKCLGPAASSEERWSFVRFARQFLYSTIVLGDKEATVRGHYMCQLAKVNRDIFLREAADMNKEGCNINYTRGFISLKRSFEAAKHAMDETIEHGEDSRLLDWDTATKMVPQLQNLPMKPLFAVHTPDAIISSCEDFFRAWTQATRKLGVEVRAPSQVDQVEVVRNNGDSQSTDVTKPRYRVRCKDGSIHDFDILVLATGVYTPLFASQLGVAEYVPTYPLRGFSHTTFVDSDSTGKGNLLKQAFSVDSMYCTSVSPFMARWAGFGEFVGYPGKSTQVPSVGPSVLSRYTNKVFPENLNGEKENAVWCFRPTSPDDLPIVGAIPKLPGLFVHTGHGTLGWTTGLATGECLAKEICESLKEDINDDKTDRKFFHFPNGINIERRQLSPTRFVPKAGF